VPEIDIAFSPCPNDTFIFHAMINNLINTHLTFVPFINEVETLNKKAFNNTYSISKLSFHAYLLLKKQYELLDSGAALGYGCGPLLVAGPAFKSLKNAKIAVPGIYTTAHLLLKLWNPEIRHIETTRFDNILPGVSSGKYDAGVIIHEGRFIYPEHNCTKIVDLGEWWQEKTGLPIPLGCIAVRRDEATISYKKDIESDIRDSVKYALKNRNASNEFVRYHAQEMDKQVIDKHINLYVNDFTISLGELGMTAVRTLEEMALCLKAL